MGLFRIREAEYEDQDELFRMRRRLWPDCPDEEQRWEIATLLAETTETLFVAGRVDGGLCGFLEASLRSRADGCETSPVGYVEGWYVDEDVRMRGVGRALIQAAEEWARSRGCREMASDAELWNHISHEAHAALGYEETGRVVQFKKTLI